MNKSQFIDRIRRTREEGDALIAQMDDAQMVQAGISGEWSAKDILAHITWHEREMIKVLQARALIGSELWALPPDQRNDTIYEENKARPLQEVRDEARQVFALLWSLLESLSEEDLHDPYRFAEMPVDWQPWQVIASNTYEHYEHHIRQVRAWLTQEMPSP